MLPQNGFGPQSSCKRLLVPIQATIFITPGRGVPLQVEPSSGLLEAGSSVQLLAKISAGDPGALSGELLIMLATGGSAGSGSRISASGGEAAQQQKQLLAEPAARCPVGANVVACTYEIRSESGGSLKAVSHAACMVPY